jgi:hypothetical protein
MLLVLNDLFLNKVITLNEEKVQESIKNLNLGNNNFNFLNYKIGNMFDPDGTITERKDFEKNNNKSLSSFTEILDIFTVYSFRILLRESLFHTKVSTFEKTKTFTIFMKTCKEKIQIIVSNIEDNNNTILDEKVKEYITKLTYKEETLDKRNTIRKNNLTASKPNSYIKFLDAEDIIKVLSAIDEENINETIIDELKISIEEEENFYQFFY